MNKTLYEILKVSPDADHEVIEFAYQNLKKKLEARIDEDSQIELKAIEWAFSTLKNPLLRQKYDEKLALDQTEILQSKLAGSPIQSENVKENIGSDVANTFLEWWSSKKVAAIIGIVAVLVGLSFILDYDKENKKTGVEMVKEERKADNISKSLNNENISTVGHIQNQGKTIDAISNIAEHQQVRLDKELEYKANARTMELQLEQQRQAREHQLALHRLEMERERVSAQKEKVEQQRIQRELNYYSCYNQKWDANGGDGAAARAACAHLK